MGPSLRPEDLDQFKGFRTFACNKIYLAFDKTDWRPDYYSVCDILVAQNNRDAILKADFRHTLPIHSISVWPELHDQKNAICYAYGKSIADWKSSENPSITKKLIHGVHSHGCSVLIDQIQIAYVMGFRNVYLVGVDFSFSGGISTGDRCSSGEVLKSDGEVNHFHKDYRKHGETWTVPKMNEQEHGFDFCRAAYEAAGINLYNASRESKLTVLRRVSFEKIFMK
jgi:hypothetical protein